MGTSLPPVGVRFQAEGVPQVTAAFDQLAGKARTTGSTISSTFVGAGGRVTAFGRSSVQAINATGFAVSQLASTGQVGFRSLASATAGFASFFGPAGLIATGVISLGLVLGDFWQRQRKEIEDTKKLVETGLGEIAARRQRDDPVGVAVDRLKEAQKAVEANRKAIADLFDPAKRTVQLKEGSFVRPVDQKALAALSEERLKLLQIETERLRAVNDAQSKAAGTTKSTTGATKGHSDAAKEAERALEAEISALVQLGKENQLSAADFARLIQLQEQYTLAVRAGTASLLERAEASRKLSQVEGGIAIPPLSVTGITETRTSRAPGPASQITLTAADQAKLRGAIAPATDAVGTEFGDAMSSSLQAGLINGVQTLIAGGSIESAFATFGQALVSGLAVINPWLGIAAGFLTSALGGLFGGGPKRPRAPELPIDIRRVVTDPSFRQPVKPAAQPGGRPLYVNEPAGKRQMRAWVSSAGNRGIP